MVINKIEDLGKGRRKLVLDDGQIIVLYRGELNKMRLAEGEELTGEQYGVIMEQILPKRARLRALNLLKSRPYTEHQIRMKLKDGGYPVKIIDDAIEYIKGLHIIDDYEYARTYLTYKSNNKSRRRMINDLMLKGIDKSVIESALRSVTDDGEIADEEELISRLIDKRGYNPETATYEEQQKIRAFLYGKGFSMDMIRRLT